MTAQETLLKFQELIVEAQTLLGGIDADGDYGPNSQQREKELRIAARKNPDALWPPPEKDNVVHKVLATSFADPVDVAAFRRCKANGNSDTFCFGKGDNGIGYWEDDTTTDRKIVALPPEDMVERWGSVDSARGKLVAITIGGKEVVCELLEKMPHRANIHNGAGLDMNPATCRAFGLTPPVKTAAEWRWA